MKAIDRTSAVTIAVADQDEALAWSTGKLEFEKRIEMQAAGLRWLTWRLMESPR